MVSILDPSQTYAVYLPSDYHPGRNWPLLVAMDPRGRAEVPTVLFRPAAERFGYIIISSYDTRSDVDYDPNTPAVNAMLNDAAQLFAVDRSRIYFTGFSGTARTGWVFAFQVPAGAGGLIGFGGGLPTRFTPPEEVPFPFFGAAGTLDFNYDEMAELDRTLEDLGARHRFLPFEGDHDWGDEATCWAALEWMELQAMRSGLRERDDRLLGDLLEDRLEVASGLQSDGDLHAAFRAYEAIVADFEGLRDTSRAQQLAAALRESDSVRETIELVDELQERNRNYTDRLARFFNQVRSGQPAPRPERALRGLGIPDLQRRAQNNERRLEAEAAQRLLEKIYVNAAFYGPRDLMGRGEHSRALVLLEIAESIKPEHYQVHINLARVHAQLGDTDAAMEALLHVEQLMELEASWLEGDPYLEPIQTLPEFQELLERLRRQRT